MDEETLQEQIDALRRGMAAVVERVEALEAARETKEP